MRKVPRLEARDSANQITYGTPPGALGDYSASLHLQGELLGTMLDFMVRDATNGRRSLDDVLRAMLERFGGERGYAGRDIDRTVAAVCGCAVAEFFDRHVRAGNPLDVDHYLARLGLRTRVTWAPTLGRDSQPQPDLRAYAWMPPPVSTAARSSPPDTTGPGCGSRTFLKRPSGNEHCERGGSLGNRRVLLVPHQEVAWLRASSTKSTISSTARRSSPSMT